MPDEIQISAEKWQELLDAQIAKTAQKPTRATVPSTKPYAEKSFVSVHYTAAGQSDADSTYKNRNEKIYVVAHFYMRPGDTWQAVTRDALNYFHTFPDCKLIVHDHAWNEPCSPAPKLRKCRELS